jgi:amidase
LCRKNLSISSSDGRQKNIRQQTQPETLMNHHVDEIVALDAVALSSAIKSRQVSCVEVMRSYLGQIDRMNPRVNAIVSLQPREELLAQAQERDGQLARGEYLGWMHGFPHGVKDLEPTIGIRTTMGSPLFKDFIPKSDSIMVERIKRAGAIIIGKTNVPEFGMGSQSYNPVFGTTLNPYDQTMTAGGSSGGAAAALALRMLPVCDGSDFAGSLRNPAAFNNVFGFRTSFGRVPSELHELFSASMAVHGPMARTVPDLAMLLSVIAGYDARAPLSLHEDPAAFAQPLNRDFAGARIGWLGDFGGYLPFDLGVLELCQSTLKVFEELGCNVDEVVPDYPLERVWQSCLTLRSWMVASRYRDLYNDPARRALIKPEAQWEIERGLNITGLEIANALAVRTAWYRIVRALFERYDFLIAPSGQVFPFGATVHWPKEVGGRTMDTYHRWMEVMIPITMSGCPALSVPAGFSEAGLPMGIQIVGSNHGEMDCLQLAYAYDQATRWVTRRLPACLSE